MIARRSLLVSVPAAIGMSAALPWLAWADPAPDWRRRRWLFDRHGGVPLLTSWEGFTGQQFHVGAIVHDPEAVYLVTHHEPALNWATGWPLYPLPGFRSDIT